VTAIADEIVVQHPWVRCLTPISLATLAKPWIGPLSAADAVKATVHDHAITSPATLPGVST